VRGISALMGADHAADVAAALAFNERNITPPWMCSRSRPRRWRNRALARVFPHSIKTYVEIPIENDPRELVSALASEAARQMRTGGVVPGRVRKPSTWRVSSTRATPPMLGSRPRRPSSAAQRHGLSYGPTPRGVMPVSQCVSRAFPLQWLTGRDTIDLLEATTLDGVTMDDEKLAWREYVVTRNEV
jgi:hypothetical protein